MEAFTGCHPFMCAQFAHHPLLHLFVPSSISEKSRNKVKLCPGIRKMKMEELLLSLHVGLHVNVSKRHYALSADS
jgi:hypothetical protein